MTPRPCAMPPCGKLQRWLICDGCLAHELERGLLIDYYSSEELALLRDACSERVDAYGVARDNLAELLLRAEAREAGESRRREAVRP